MDKKSGATVDRPGLQAALDYAREGDVIVAHTLDRLGRTVRDTLNLIHDLSQRGIGLRTLADPIKVDSSRPEDPMAQLAVVLLAMFAQMERTYAIERAAHARAVATAKGRCVGRPVLVDSAKLEWAAHLRDSGSTIAEVVEKTGIPRTSLYRHLPPRPSWPSGPMGTPESRDSATRDRTSRPAAQDPTPLMSPDRTATSSTPLRSERDRGYLRATRGRSGRSRWLCDDHYPVRARPPGRASMISL